MLLDNFQTCRDFISWGYKPHLEVLDKLLACLRLQPPRQQQQPSADVQRSQQLQAQLQPLLPGQAQAMLQEQCAIDDDPCNQQQAILRELANPGERRGLGGGLGGGLGLAGGAGGSGEAGLQERPYEVPFDKRAMDAVLDAINMGLLPSMKVRMMLWCKIWLCCFVASLIICCGRNHNMGLLPLIKGEMRLLASWWFPAKCLHSTLASAAPSM